MGLLDWFRKKQPENPLTEQHKLIIKKTVPQFLLLNQSLLDGYELLQQAHEDWRKRFIVWLSAATLQNGGKFVLKKDFIDAILSNPKLKLNVTSTEDGCMELLLKEGDGEDEPS